MEPGHSSQERTLTLVTVLLGALALGVLLILQLRASVPVSAAPAAGPAGCAACHAPGKVRTLDAALKTIRNHPQLPAPTVAMCVACHKPDGKAPALGPVLHRRHLRAAAFSSTYKGTCTSCHTVDLKTGVVTVIGLPPK
jgi:cytochrome c553